MNKTYDVIVVGGGTSGVSAAYTAAKMGLSVLVVEKNVHLGGTITSGLVIPAMKTNDEDINTEFYNDLVKYSARFGAQNTYSDGNPGWFNPELLKIVLDSMLTDVGVDILYSTCFDSISVLDNGYFKLLCTSEMLSICFVLKYVVDSSGNGKLFQSLGAKFLNCEKKSQAVTLRFTMANVDLKTFSDWILEVDSNRLVTSAQFTDSQIHLSTACTWDSSGNWALRPIFDKAVSNGDLKLEDTAYFQVFTIPGMPTSIAFNCPRIPVEDSCDVSDPYIRSKALIKGREQIFRLSKFCNKYFPGFENAYISNIADMLGIRESGRFEGKYVYTEKDIINKTKFDEPVLSSDYPIDIHSNQKDMSRLEYVKGNYYLPIEALMSKDYDNLFGIGRCVSASFAAQAALRIQPSCFSMGEAVAKYIKKKEG